jgi:hypothetical protein
MSKRLREDDNMDHNDRSNKKIITEDNFANNKVMNHDDNHLFTHEEQNTRMNTQSLSIRRKCPYLDTINRNYLDFDNEKLCSVTLSNLNVYACLVCGKFFQGRSKSSVAYTHSVQCGHFVFINLHDCRAYCLPDNYEIHDTSLDDIKRCLAPKFSAEEVVALDSNSSLARDVYGITYLPGFVGLNNLKATDYMNVVLHALAHIPTIRNFFLSSHQLLENKSHLVKSFAMVRFPSILMYCRSHIHYASCIGNCEDLVAL